MPFLPLSPAKQAAGASFSNANPVRDALDQSIAIVCSWPSEEALGTAPTEPANQLPDSDSNEGLLTPFARPGMFIDIDPMEITQAQFAQIIDSVVRHDIHKRWHDAGRPPGHARGRRDRAGGRVAARSRARRCARFQLAATTPACAGNRRLRLRQARHRRIRRQVHTGLRPARPRCRAGVARGAQTRGRPRGEDWPSP